MKKYFAAVIILIVLQLICLLGVLALAVDVRSDCNAVGTHNVWFQCTGNSDPDIPAYVAFVLLPPIVTKFLLDRLKQKISWGKIIALHVVTGIVVFLFLYVASTPDCGCGGA
ncbi:MAG TPA: hypothetical protein VN554_01220 [Verrucomicrobiae bacterium]|nr:hypothetical protein [Verrucomicrobiae bacterium]